MLYNIYVFICCDFDHVYFTYGYILRDSALSCLYILFYVKVFFCRGWLQLLTTVLHDNYMTKCDVSGEKQ